MPLKLMKNRNPPNPFGSERVDCEFFQAFVFSVFRDKCILSLSHNKLLDIVLSVINSQLLLEYTMRQSLR